MANFTPTKLRSRGCFDLAALRRIFLSSKCSPQIKGPENHPSNKKPKKNLQVQLISRKTFFFVAILKEFIASLNDPSYFLMVV